jgi:tetratricopeptide (TPR) repeat protein
MNVNLKAVEFNSKLKKEKTKSLESDALSILNSKNLPKNYKTTVRTLEFLAEMSIQLKRYTNVEHYLNQIIEIKKELYGDNSTEYHLAQLKLAIFYVDYTNKLDEAKKIFDESYTNMVAKEIKLQHKDRLPILYSLAKLYDLTDNYSLASKTLKEAGDAARDRFTKDKPEFAVALTQIAQLEIKLGNYTSAEDNINAAIKVLEDKRKDDLHVAKYIHAIETQARLYGIQGMFDEAAENLKESSKRIRKADVLIEDELSTAAELSTVLIQLGKYSDTDRLLTELISQNEKLFGTSSIRLIEPLVNRGKIQLARGEYTEAEKTALRANQIAVKTYTDNSTKTALTQRLMSDIYYT